MTTRADKHSNVAKDALTRTAGTEGPTIRYSSTGTAVPYYTTADNDRECIVYNSTTYDDNYSLSRKDSNEPSNSPPRLEHTRARANMSK